MNFDLRPNSYRFSMKNRSRYTAETLVLEARYLEKYIDDRLKRLGKRRVGQMEFMGEERAPFHTKEGHLLTPAMSMVHAHCYMENDSDEFR